MRRLLLSLSTLFLIFGTGCTKKEKPENVSYEAYSVNVKGLDPIAVSDLYQHKITSHIFEGLLAYHPFKRPLELVPQLASEMPKISKDGKTYTFNLKKGVVFQDDPSFTKNGGKGREVVADDFIYSWKRLADPANAAEGWWVLDGKIKGLNEWRTAKANGKADYATPIAGLKSKDKYSLEITLTKTNYQFLYILAMPQTFVVAKEAADHYGKEMLNHPVGTGPFKLTEWIRNNKIVLEKSPSFRHDPYPSDGEEGDKEAGLLKDAGQPTPLVDKVVFYEIIEDQPAWLNFLKGNSDFGGVPKDNFSNAVEADGKTLKPELQKKGISLEIRPDVDVTFDSMNMKDPFLGKHKLVRQAMSLAIDRVNLIEKFYNGRAIAAQGPVPPTIDGYDPNFKNPYARYDVKKAKELLVKAGFPGGKGIPELQFETTSSTTARQMAEHFQHAMAAIGIKIKINTNTWPEMTEKVKTNRFQIFGMAWSADYPDAENFLQLFWGPNKNPGPNNSNYDNPEFNKIYEQAMKLPPGPKRTQLYYKLRDIVVEDCPWIFNVHRKVYTFTHSWTKNFKPHKTIQQHHKYIRVDGKLRAEQKSKL